MDDSSQTTLKTLTANVKSAGCAAKLSSSELDQILSKLPISVSPNLLSGIHNFEDAAVYKISEDLAIVQTVDFFPPVVDDPFLYGSIAATNALSDIYAMGGKPILALNVLCFPTCDFPLSVVSEILAGGAQQVEKAGAVVGGGHSIQLSEPVYGLCVTGVIDPKLMLTNGGARTGDKIVLCKPIGTGVALLAVRANLLSSEDKENLLRYMTMLNEAPLAIARKFSPHAATDVTGFGLIGHLHEMAKASRLQATVFIDSVPLLPEVSKLASEGFVPSGAYGNRSSYEKFVRYINDVDLTESDLLYDPQTSGGLLFSVAEESADLLVADLKSNGLFGQVIGAFSEGDEGLVEVVGKNG